MSGHECIVGRTPIGPPPSNPCSQRYGTTVACTCGWDFGVVTTEPVSLGGTAVATARWRRQLRDERLLDVALARVATDNGRRYDLEDVATEHDVDLNNMEEDR